MKIVLFLVLSASFVFSQRRYDLWPLPKPAPPLTFTVGEAAGVFRSSASSFRSSFGTIYPSDLVICGDNCSDPLVKISLTTGEIKYGSKYKPDTAAKIFWQDDPTAVVEPLTQDEIAKLDAARKVVAEAQRKLEEVEASIRKAHGDSVPSRNFGMMLSCDQPDYFQVDIHGKWALKVARKGWSCLTFY